MSLGRFVSGSSTVLPNLVEWSAQNIMSENDLKVEKVLVEKNRVGVLSSDNGHALEDLHRLRSSQVLHLHSHATPMLCESLFIVN